MMLAVHAKSRSWASYLPLNAVAATLTSEPVHLAIDGLTSHKTTLVKAYVASTDGMLTLHVLPDYAPELNPDELVWSHTKRTGVARAPLRQGEKLRDKVETQLATIKRAPQLVRSLFKTLEHF